MGQGKSKQEKLQTHIFRAKVQVSGRTGQAGGKEEQPPPAPFQQGQTPGEWDGGLRVPVCFGEPPNAEGRPKVAAHAGEHLLTPCREVAAPLHLHSVPSCHPTPPFPKGDHVSHIS